MTSLSFYITISAEQLDPLVRGSVGCIDECFSSRDDTIPRSR